MRFAFRIILIVLAAIACNVDRPLPPPNNPTSATRLCDPKLLPCSGDDVCHLAIGGGTCAAACSDDATCNDIIAGYVCHTQLGVCAPSCSSTFNGRTGDAICQSLGGDHSCGVGGQCIPEPPSQPVGFRVFNASDLTIDVVAQGISGPATQLGPGGLTPLRNAIPSGSYVFTVLNSADASNVATEAVTLGATLEGKHRYLAYFYKRGTDYRLEMIEDVPVAAPVAGEAWFRYLNLDSVQKDVREAATPSTPIITIVSQGEVRAPLGIAAGVHHFAVGASPGLPATMLFNATLEAGGAYVVITWPNFASRSPETVLIGPGDAPIASGRPAGIKLVNGMPDSPVSLSVTGNVVLNLADPGFKQNPNPGYLPIAPGLHVFETTPLGPVPDAHALGAGQHYSVGCFGGVSKPAEQAATAKCKLFDDDAPAAPAPGFAAMRSMHVAIDAQDLVVEMTAVVLSPTTQVITLGTSQSYGTTLPPFKDVPTVAPSVVHHFDAVFANGPPLSFLAPPLTPGVSYTLVVISLDVSTFQGWLLDTLGNATQLQPHTN